MTALQVTCPANLATTLPSASIGNCSAYYECMPGQVAVKKFCGDGLLFNPETDSCDYRENVNCEYGLGMENMLTMILQWLHATSGRRGLSNGSWDSSKTCRNHPGYLEPHDTACDKYYLCSNGRPYLRTCPSGLFFNNNTKTCDNNAASGPCLLANKCAGANITLNNQPIYIQSHPGHGSTVRYDNNLNCDWYFRSCPTCGTIIRIEIVDFFIDCTDTLTFEVAGNPVLQTRLCGGNEAGRIMILDVSGYRNLTYPLRMNFRTDNERNQAGFGLRISATSDLPEVPYPPIYGSVGVCGGEIPVSEQPHRLYSHWNYITNPSTYGPNMNCTWNLTPCASCANLVIVEVERFDLEGASPCVWDWLALGDPTNSQTRKLCGAIPERSTYVMVPSSATNRTTINFRTDYSVQKTGFSLKLYSISAARRFTPEVTRLLRTANQNEAPMFPYEKPAEDNQTTL